MSPVLTASPDLAKRFLPPKPYFSSFFCLKKCKLKVRGGGIERDARLYEQEEREQKEKK